VYFVDIKLAPSSSVKQNRYPTVLNIPGFSDSTHFYFFDDFKMSSTPAPSNSATNVPAFVERVASVVRDHMDTIPSGGVAGEEEYAMWGKDFVKNLVRHKSDFIIF